MNKSFGGIIKIYDLGRISIPIEARKALGIQEKDCLEFLIDVENRRLILQKVLAVCLKCQSTEHLKEVTPGLYLCDNCIETLK